MDESSYPLPASVHALAPNPSPMPVQATRQISPTYKCCGRCYAGKFRSDCYLFQLYNHSRAHAKVIHLQRLKRHSLCALNTFFQTAHSPLCVGRGYLRVNTPFTSIYPWTYTSPIVETADTLNGFNQHKDLFCARSAHSPYLCRCQWFRIRRRSSNCRE